ncbi:MAG: invasion associated locus B family protein [Gammaproteobacteria bacterium]|nr:invasion associated locus B family protein [Gammaproteobacteria bacterium]
MKSNLFAGETSRWKRFSGARLFLSLLCLFFLAGSLAADPVTEESFRDWLVRCDRQSESDVELCFMEQNLMLKEGNRQLLNVVVGYPSGKKQVMAVFTLPLGIYLPPGLALRIDSGKTIQFPIQHCIQSGCKTRLPLSKSQIRQMKAGRQGFITVHDGANQRIVIPFSLLGFTAALKSINEK